jgi:epoxyqueuosine reductase
MAPQAPESLTPAGRSGLIKRRAVELGFDAAGVSGLEPIPHADALDRWLEAGRAGTMRYLHRQAARRKQPATILSGATRAVVLTRNYYTPDPPPRPGTGRVAKYARGQDYHDGLRPALDALRQFLVELGASPARTRAYVDAGPVPERELAQRAGLGWIGKNTMLISPDRGSFFFLATILTDLDLAVDRPMTADHCGTCTRCLDACPTGALPEARVLDATRCISYLTIEYHGAALPDPRQVGNWVFGCDVCQDVCPWNLKFADPVPPGDPLHLDSAGGLVALDELLEMNPAAFDRRFGRTPFERPGLPGMQRNARAAAANTEDSRCPMP